MKSIIVPKTSMSPLGKNIGVKGSPTSSPAIAGIGAVVLLLGGTRWGSYIGASPVFLTDVLVAFAVLHWILSRQLRRDKYPSLPNESRVPWLLAIIPIYVFVRLITGQHFDLIAIRDAAPYLYSLVGLLAWASSRWASEASQERTRRLLMWALGFHCAWFFVANLVWPELPSSMPRLSVTQDLHVFTPRTDIDTAIVGVLAAVVLVRLIKGSLRHPWVTYVVFGACWIAILSASSRAGLIGALIVNIYALFVGLRHKGQNSTRKLVTVSMLPLLVGAALVVLPSTDIGTRLFATIGVNAASSDELARGAAGTTRARSKAWEGLVEWTTEEPSRFVWGEGLGPNIMTLSGAGILLVGHSDEPEATPRSPHNYWAGSFARLGLFGTVPLVLLSVAFLLRSLRRSNVESFNELRLILHLVPLSIIVPATFGVVLESPFGAIPFFWCIGALVGLGEQARSTTSRLK